MKPRQIENVFLSLCREYAAHINALGTEVEEKKNVCVFTVHLKSTGIQFVYRLKPAALTVRSTLYCRVFPDKNCPVYLFLPQLMPLLGIEDYRCCYFPYIETDKRMQACFRQLTLILDPLLPVLEGLAATGDDKMLLRRFLVEAMKETDPDRILRNGTAEQRMYTAMQQAGDSAFITRFTEFAPWRHYVFCRHGEALKEYKKLKDLLPYEQGLCRFLQTREGRMFIPMPPECFALQDLQRVTSGREDSGTLFKGMLLLYPVSAAFFCLIMGLLQMVLSYKTRCWLGAPWYQGFLLGALPALFGGIALRRWLMPVLNRSSYIQQRDFDDLFNGRGLSRAAAGIFAVAIAGALAAASMMSFSCVRFYDQFFDLDRGLFTREAFTYEQIDAVYHIDARYNMYAERIERESWVIGLKNGEYIDLDGYAAVKETEEKVLPLFTELGIEMINLDSDRDLPEV